MHQPTRAHLPSSMKSSSTFLLSSFFPNHFRRQWIVLVVSGLVGPLPLLGGFLRGALGLLRFLDCLIWHFLRNNPILLPLRRQALHLPWITYTVLTFSFSAFFPFSTRFAEICSVSFPSFFDVRSFFSFYKTMTNEPTMPTFSRNTSLRSFFFLLYQTKNEYILFGFFCWSLRFSHRNLRFCLHVILQSMQSTQYTPQCHVTSSVLRSTSFAISL